MAVRARRFGAYAAMRIDRVTLNRELSGQKPTVCPVGQSMVKRKFGAGGDEVHLLRSKLVPTVWADYSTE